LPDIILAGKLGNLLFEIVVMRILNKWRFAFWALYFSGFLLTGVLLLHGAFIGGGFQRGNAAGDLFTLAIMCLAAAVFWPLLFIIVILQVFGVAHVPISLGPSWAV